MEQGGLSHDIIRFDHKQRLTDRFLTSELHHLTTQNRQITIAVLIEIINPWHPTSQLGQIILNNLVREFSRSQSNSILGRFEQALKFVNRHIEDVIEKTHAPVAGAVALFEDGEVHLASVGAGKLLLIRNDTPTIVSGKSPGQTFSSVTSGDLRETDWLCIANEGFAQFIEELPPEKFHVGAEELETTVREAAATQEKLSWAGIFIRPRFDKSGVQRVVLWDEIEPVMPIKLPAFKLNVDWGKAFEGIKGFFASFSQRLRTLTPGKRPAVNLPKIPFGPSVLANKRVLAMLIFALLVAAGIGAGVWQLRKNNQVTPVQNLLTTVQAASVDNQLSTLIDNFSLESYASLSDEDKEALKTLLQNSQTQLVLPTLITELPESIVDLDASANLVTLVDSTGQLWMLKTGPPVQVAQTQKIPLPISLAAFGENNIVVSDTAGNIWRFDGSNTQPVALSLPNAIAQGTKSLEMYQNNLYIYLNDARTIYRVTNFTGDLAAASLYSRSETLPSEPLADWAVNGEVILATTTGTITDLLRNQRGNLNATLPRHDQTVRLSAETSFPDIISSSGRLIFRHSAEGTLIKTLFIPLQENISGIHLDTADTSQVWLSSGKNLYRVSL